MIGKVHGRSHRGGGNRFSRSGPCSEAQERSAHISPSKPQGMETSKLATSCILIFRLATARILYFSLPPPLFPIWCPHYRPGIYRCQRSPATRSATLSQCLRQWNNTAPRQSKELLGWCLVLISVFSGFTFSLIFLIISRYRCSLAKLAAI